MAETENMKGEIRKILDELATKRQKKIITTSVRSGRRADVIVVGKRGHYVRHRKPTDDKIRDIAILPTISAAIMRSGRDFSIAKEDFREKVRRKKISTLLAIVFDGSSSMIKDDKIGSIKEILDIVLLDAYQKRDRVSLIIYNGQAAKVIMPFSSSVESAKRFIEIMQYGGTTPLSSGILGGLQMLKQKMLSEPESIPLMLVITDGSTNVPITPGADVYRELMEACATVKDAGINVLIIDVQRGGSPVAKKIANACGARYFIVRTTAGEEEKIDLVNHEVIKYALSLLLIDNELGHVLIRGCSQEAVAAVLGDIEEIGMEIEVVEDCKYNCDPRKPQLFCPDCVEKYGDKKAPFMLQPLRIVRVDHNVTLDSLKGTFDGKGFNRGSFARVNRGILYIDGIDKLGLDVVNALTMTLNTKTNIVDSDRGAIVHPVRFILVGRLSDPGTKLQSSLFSHTSILVDTVKMGDIERRIRRIQQQKEFDTDSKKFRQNLKKRNKENLFKIIRARTLLPGIQTPDASLDVIGRICVESNVASNFIDVLIERIARANAAYSSRNVIDMNDIIVASEYILPLYTNRNVSTIRSMTAIHENVQSIREWVNRFA
jgi:Mg-chelatase subunit ChlD/Mg-chelatase subunit ChlI